MGWFRGKNPVLRFAVLFGLLVGLLYAALGYCPFGLAALTHYLGFIARAASCVCNWFGQHTSAAGGTVLSSGFGLKVDLGCEATEPWILFVAAVLAFPVSFRRKIPGVVLGTLALLAVNLARIVSLFLVGVYFPNAFQWIHLEVWQIMFTLLAIVLWAVWIQWAMNPRQAVSHEPG